MPASTQTESETPHAIFSKTRMETLSDGVFAVAMTLLVVDISTVGLPNLEHDWWPDFWPKAVSFIDSFVVVAVYWVVHHNEMASINGTTREFNWLNLLFLLFIVLIPFSAALLGGNWNLAQHVSADRFWYLRIPILVYSANLILAGASLQAVWWYAKRQRNAQWQESIFSCVVTDSIIKRTFARNSIIPVAAVLVLLISLLSVNTGQLLLVFVPLSYALWTLWAAHKIRKEHKRAAGGAHRA